MYNIFLFFLTLLVISTTIAIWPYVLDAMLIMYIDGIMPICTGIGIS